MPTKDVLDAAANPMAWFQHDANAAQDLKCQRLLLRYGNTGYGAFWRLCEILASTKTHALPIETDEDWLILAQQIGMRSSGMFDELSSVDDCREFISCLLEIGLIVRNGKGHIESVRMQKNALYFGARRAGGAKGGRASKKKQEQAN